MASEKRYFWLKLPEGFFRQKEIKRLRKIAGGDTYTIIYLKMLLRSLSNNGVLFFDGVENDFVSELALDIDEDEENVAVTVQFLMKQGILEEINEDEYLLKTCADMVGSETSGAIRTRRYRESKRELLPMKIEAKTNAERQKAYRAKKYCEELRHIPLCDDATNRHRYGGNYYVVFKRDGCKCSLCDSTENLCVHHIDGYDEYLPQNNEENKMMVLCRKCHSNVHYGLEIPSHILDRIGYYRNENVTSNENCDACVTTCNADVHLCNTEIDIEKEIDIELEKEKSKKKKSPTVYYPTDELLNQAFLDYIEMRKKIKKPLATERAMKLAMDNLKKLSNGDNDVAIQILNQSIMNSWQGLFPLKQEAKKQTSKSVFDEWRDA